MWKPTIGDILSTDRELSNEDGKFTVGVYETDSTGNKLVGHLPAEFSRTARYFINNGGEIPCQVTGKRVHSQGPRGEMEKLQWTSSNMFGSWTNLLQSREAKFLEDMD